MIPTELRSYAFRRERERGWSELARRVSAVERGGPGALGPTELAELPMLYRSALSSLSVARAISLDRNLLDYLESLCARAFCCVHAPRRRWGPALLAFLRHDVPAAARGMVWHAAAAAFLMAFGAVAGFWLTLDDPVRFHAFVDPAYAQDRGPAASTEALRDALYGRGSAAQLGAFSAMLFTHNATIALLCFSLGAAAGLPVLFLMLTNGLVLGAFAALYQSRGLGVEFWAWILPHGVFELSAIVLAGGAGLKLAHGLLFPGPWPRPVTLYRAGREAAVVTMGALALLLAAGLVEGFFRQAVHSVPLRYLMAGLGALLLPAWLLSGAAARAGTRP